MSKSLIGLIRSRMLPLAQREGFPYYVQNGRYVLNDGEWGGGFFIGILWHYYRMLREDGSMEEAERVLRLIQRKMEELAPLRFRPTFDVGFMFFYSAVRGYQILGDERWLQYARDAVETQKSRFHPAARMIYHDYRFDERRYTGSIIDTLPDVVLLWWAAKELKDVEAEEMVITHFYRIAELLLRDDGSVWQTVWFDPETGAVLFRENFQGDAPDGVWSRGQAWGILGFAQAWHYTGNNEYRAYAERLAEYFLANVNADGTVPWDFRSERRDILDNSAAVIALTGAKILNDSDSRWDRVEEALQPFIAPPDKEGLLDGGTFFVRWKWGVMSPNIWGDFFWVESQMM